MSLAYLAKGADPGNQAGACQALAKLHASTDTRPMVSRPIVNDLLVLQDCNVLISTHRCKTVVLTGAYAA